jgi:hypothetical protein
MPPSIIAEEGKKAEDFVLFLQNEEALDELLENEEDI